MGKEKMKAEAEDESLKVFVLRLERSPASENEIVSLWEKQAENQL